MHCSAAWHVREKCAFTQHRASADQRHPHARLFVFIVNAERSAFDKIQSAVQRPLLHQHLAAVQGKRLHVAGQDVPMRLVELTAQCVTGVAVQDGLGQALDVKTDGGG